MRDIGYAAMVVGTIECVTYALGYGAWPVGLVGLVFGAFGALIVRSTEWSNS